MSASGGSTSDQNISTNKVVDGQSHYLAYITPDEGKSLVDLPGYGYAKVPGAMRNHWQTILPAYLQERQSLAGLIIVMEFQHTGIIVII